MPVKPFRIIGYTLWGQEPDCLLWNRTKQFPNCLNCDVQQRSRQLANAVALAWATERWTCVCVWSCDWWRLWSASPPCCWELWGRWRPSHRRWSSHPPYPACYWSAGSYLSPLLWKKQPETSVLIRDGCDIKINKNTQKGNLWRKATDKHIFRSGATAES